MLFVFCLACLESNSLTIDSTTVDEHKFSESEWKKITKEIDYSKEKAPPLSSPGNFSMPVSAGAAKIILFALISALLIFILVRVFKGNIFLANKKVNNNDDATFIQPEEDIHLADLDKAYNNAIIKGDYRLAIRIRYLMSIKELSEQQLIKWKRDKTNSEYIFEMMNNSAFNHFREITNIFERIWYGDVELTEPVFKVVNPKFNLFISEIKNQNRTASN